MKAIGLSYWVLVVACAGTSGGTSSGASERVVNPQPQQAPKNVEGLPAVASDPVPGASLGIAIACSACAGSPEQNLRVNVNRLNQCMISNSSKELTLGVTSTALANRDGFRVKVPGYYDRGAGTYQVDVENAIALNDANAEITLKAGSSPCSRGCTVTTTDDKPAATPGIHDIQFDVRCPELCFSNQCNKCTAPGGGEIRFQWRANCESN